MADSGSSRWHGARPLRGGWALSLAVLLVAAASVVRAGDARGEGVAGVLQTWLVEGVGMPPAVAALPSRAAWPGVYTTRRYVPIWLKEGRPTASAQGLLEAMTRLPEEGIDVPATYPALADEVAQAATRSLDNTTAAALELRLTDALHDTASALYGGRTSPETMDPSWYLGRPELDFAWVVATLDSGVPVGQLLAGLTPPQAEYKRLRTLLAHYRGLARADGQSSGLPEVPPGPTLRPGERGAAVPAIRERLIASGDAEPLAAGQAANLYDPALVDAMKAFQARHGLKADGAVGGKTRDLLNNASAGRRLAQIRAVMERWRWLPRNQADAYVLVNTAAFDLHLFEKGAVTLSMRVIVGRAEEKWSTPSFAAEISQVVLNPYWNIPSSIVKEEIRRNVSRDPNYLSRKGIHAVGSDGQRIDLSAEQLLDDINGGSVNYRLRQGYGNGNALGRMKLMLPNRFGIYLHDTPNRALFSNSNRALSHGCVRLEQPYQLAARLLGGEWTATSLEKTALNGQQQTVDLARPAPAYMAYLSVWVDADGNAKFHQDHYQRDGRLMAAFNSQLPDATKNVDRALYTGAAMSSNP